MKSKAYTFKVVVVKNTVCVKLLSRKAAVTMGLVSPAVKDIGEIFGTIGLMKTEQAHSHLKPYSVPAARGVPSPLLEKVREELDRMEKA
ncbi:Pol polyprotein [Plakobranchus ocellatus]|uniref:Pol polyprotein n=1 Tax=Plakobranchus ocellatus TaxID=259542 RepID=A0AAV4AXK2_9GAST|nr:Pol polyprotein [Plakobranchus ocellatus]